jgi:uncharacterized protein
MSVMGGLLGREFVAGDSVTCWLTVLEDSQLITREADPFRKGRSLCRIFRKSRSLYRTAHRLLGGTSCREWALSPAGDDAFGEPPGEVAAGVVADPLRCSQIQVDVAVFAFARPGLPCYSGAGFAAELGDMGAADTLVQLIGLHTLYGMTAG